MNVDDTNVEVFVEVTDEYRRTFNPSDPDVDLSWMIHGRGYGKIVSTETKHDPWSDACKLVPTIEWADGFISSMSISHLQQSTKKRFFTAALK